jgi:hypothetical protein
MYERTKAQSTQVLLKNYLLWININISIIITKARIKEEIKKTSNQYKEFLFLNTLKW